MHRDLSVVVQLRHYVAMDVINDVFVGDAFASDSELETLSKVDRKILSFNVDLIDGLGDIKEVCNLDFSRRPDSNDYMIRTLESRFALMKRDIPAFNTIDIKRGDILFENNEYGQYKGELQVALKDMKNSGRTNVIGHINDKELFLLDYIKPGQSFRLKTNQLS